MGSYRSAVVFYYKGKNMRLDGVLDTKLSNFMSGFKRAIADAKQKVMLFIKYIACSMVYICSI